MAITATYSPITATLSVDITAAGVYTIDNPALAFRIVAIQAYTTVAGNITVTDGTNDIAAVQALPVAGWAGLILTEANCNINTSENLRITTTNAGATKLVISCTDYNGGYNWAAS